MIHSARRPREEGVRGSRQQWLLSRYSNRGVGNMSRRNNLRGAFLQVIYLGGRLDVRGSGILSQWWAA